MKEFVEKLIGRLEKLKLGVMLNNKCCKHIIDKSIEIVNQLSEEYKDKVIIDGQYCFQTCGANEHCKECNRLSNGSIDYYENYDCLAEEYNNGWISVSELADFVIVGGAVFHIQPDAVHTAHAGDLHGNAVGAVDF